MNSFIELHNIQIAGWITARRIMNNDAPITAHAWSDRFVRNAPATIAPCNHCGQTPDRICNRCKAPMRNGWDCQCGPLGDLGE